MKIIALFNNKGGVGKSTLCYHLGCALGEMGKKVLFVDLDPQCNLTISGMFEEQLHHIWQEEDDFIEDFENALQKAEDKEKIFQSTRSIHFLLKPAEDGLNELTIIPPPFKICENVDIIPGRLSLHKYENKIAERWNSVFSSDNLSIRTLTNIRRICDEYYKIYNYDYILIDTSPSLGILNKTIISTVDGFLIPTQPDMFSSYGIRNIGNSLEQWQKEFNTIYKLISKEKREKFPQKFVQFIGYTIYNAKKSSKNLNDYDLASAHYSYAKKIPQIIYDFIRKDNMADINNISEPIGGKSVMHSHNTYTSVAQALKCPIWQIPEQFKQFEATESNYLDELQLKYNTGNNGLCRATKDNYIDFAKDFMKHAGVL